MKRQRTTPTPSVLRRVQQEATNKYNDLRDTHLRNLTNYRWLRYVIALWTFRMMFVAIGFLFPLLSLLSTSTSESLSFELLEADWKQSDDSFIRSLVSKETPFLLKHAPVPDSSIVGYLLLSYLSASLPGIKQSKNPLFPYFSSEQQWSPNVLRAEHWESITLSKENFLTQLKLNHDDQSRRYFYFSKLIRSPATNPLLLSLAPFLLDLPAAVRGVEPEFRLWLGSENVSAAPHYDMEHNFFLQVNGTKTFLIGSPALSKLFESHSILHPQWRQAQQSHLTSVDAVYNYVSGATSPPLTTRCDPMGNMSTTGMRRVLVSSSLQSLQWGPICSADFTLQAQPHHSLQRNKRKGGQKPELKEVSACDLEHGADDLCSAAERPGRQDTSPADRPGIYYDATAEADAGSAGSSSSLFEVTLHPGDMLYIPPFFFHAVTAHAHSVSLNTWIGSRYLTASDALRNVDLPYRHQADRLAQVSALAAMIKVFFLNQGSPIAMEYFASLMQSRHSRTRFGPSDCSLEGRDSSTPDSRESEKVDASMLPCSLKSLRRAGELEVFVVNLSLNNNCDIFVASFCVVFLKAANVPMYLHAEQERIVHRAAGRVGSILAEFPLSVQTAMLMDYIDEIFHLIAGPESCPATMMIFIDSCLNVQQYSK